MDLSMTIVWNDHPEDGHHRLKSHNGYSDPAVALAWVREGDNAIRLGARLMMTGHARYVAPYEVETTWKPHCDAPVTIQSWTGKAHPTPFGVTMAVPCRKCLRCLQIKQMRWRQRIINETLLTFQRGRRTWFGTLTISPIHMAGIIAEALEKFGDKSARSIDRCAYNHVRKYLDRVRKASKTVFRYCAVLERGEDNGRTHYHLMIHEVGPYPLLHRQLDTQWRSFTKWKLVHADEGRELAKVARYISTYATKTAETRIRASARYGLSIGVPAP